MNSGHTGKIAYGWAWIVPIFRLRIYKKGFDIIVLVYPKLLMEYIYMCVWILRANTCFAKRLI